MKKTLAAILAIAIIGLTSCGRENTSVETTISESTTVAETTVVTEVTTTTEATTTTAEATTTTFEVTTTIEETTTATETTIEPIDYSNFSVADYCGEFDNVKPVAYTAETIELVGGECTSEQEQLAIEAIKATDEYAEVVYYAKEMFTYENGAFNAPDNYMTEEYINFLTYENGDFVITPVMEGAFTYKVDGENEGTLLVYRIPLPDSKFESSFAAIYSMPVYINANNEAYILFEASQQFLYSTAVLISYEDGETHILFEKGHTQGTQKNYIYSFNNGVPKLEYEGYHIFTQENTEVFCSGYNTKMFFRDEVSNSYCNVAVKEASEELAEIIINAEAVNKAFPDIKEYYAENGMKVFGGKYIQACNTAFTFENGEVVEYEDYCWVSSSTDDTNYNVML